MKNSLLPLLLIGFLINSALAAGGGGGGGGGGVKLPNPNTVADPMTGIVANVSKNSVYISVMKKGKTAGFFLWGTHVTNDGHTVLIQDIKKGQKVTVTPCPWKHEQAQTVDILKASGYEDENGEVPEFFVGKIALLSNGKSGTFVTIRKGDTQLDFLLAGTRILQDGKTILGSSLKKGMTLKIYPTAWKPEQAQVIEVTAAASPTPIPGTTPRGGKKASSKTQ
jgi:hypothetical protein